jgi:hypothetical protein
LFGDARVAFLFSRLTSRPNPAIGHHGHEEGHEGYEVEPQEDPQEVCQASDPSKEWQD